MPRNNKIMEWRWFIVGSIILCAALGAFFWAFSLGTLSPSRRFLLLWMLPLASGFACGCFAGSIKATTKGTLAVVATGGFAVWLLTFFLLQRVPVEEPSNPKVINLLQELQASINDMKAKQKQGGVIFETSDLADQERALSALTSQPLDTSFTLTPGAPQWLRIALAELGQGETPGPDSNPRIIEYFSSVNIAPSELLTEDIAWSAAFVSWAFEKAGISTPRSAMNARFLNWGVRLAEPKEGCLVLIERGNSSHMQSANFRPYHSGFFIKDMGSSILIVSGNSENKVRITAVPKSRVEAYLYPPNA
jgi:uncharacterized protein (TIGR02594 family)